MGTLVLVLGTAACTDLPRQPAESSEARAQVAALVREREAEQSAMRAEVAATRIAAAKKEAEVQELRSSLVQLRQEQADAHQAFLAARQESDAHRAELERVRLDRERSQQAERSEQLVALQQTVSALTSELAQLKEKLARPSVPARQQSSRVSPNLTPRQPRTSSGKTPVILPSSTGRELNEPTVVPALGRDGQILGREAPVQVTVQPGESLWTLAKRYKISVADLRRTNRIEGDVLHAGTMLTIPPRPNATP